MSVRRMQMNQNERNNKNMELLDIFTDRSTNENRYPIIVSKLLGLSDDDANKCVAILTNVKNNIINPITTHFMAKKDISPEELRGIVKYADTIDAVLSLIRDDANKARK